MPALVASCCGSCSAPRGASLAQGREVFPTRGLMRLQFRDEGIPNRSGGAVGQEFQYRPRSLAAALAEGLEEAEAPGQLAGSPLLPQPRSIPAGLPAGPPWPWDQLQSLERGSGPWVCPCPAQLGHQQPSICTVIIILQIKAALLQTITVKLKLSSKRNVCPCCGFPFLPSFSFFLSPPSFPFFFFILYEQIAFSGL